MNNKLGICSWSMPMEWDEKLQISEQMGLNGIELDFSSNDEGHIFLNSTVERREFADKISRTNLEFKTLGVNELCKTGMALKQNQNSAVDILKRASDAALDLGCQILQVPSFGSGIIEGDEHFDNTLECFMKACEYIKNEDLLISTENGLSAEKNIEMVESLNMSHFKIYFDTQNPHLFGISSVPDMIESLLPHICEVHLKDGDGEFGNSLMGEGKADTAETVRRLMDGGYKGWFHFETSYASLAEEKQIDPRELMEQDIQWITNINEKN